MPSRLSMLGVTMNFDFADFAKGLSDFKNFFTVKHITVLVFVALALVLVCAPQRGFDSPSGEKMACDASCPLPEVITVPTVTITEVSQENWQIDLIGEGWEIAEPSRPEQKMIRLNHNPSCMVLLIKEPIGQMSFGQYVVDSIQGFSEGGAHVAALKQVTINDQKYVLMESALFDTDVLMAWNTIKDGFGYSLSCFYHNDVDAGSAQHDLCEEIASSLEIK
jgi:hypothetical protein